MDRHNKSVCMKDQEREFIAFASIAYFIVGL